RLGKSHEKKNGGEASVTLPVAECATVVFMGTFVRGGRCRAVVVCTGGKTEFGRAATDMKELKVQRSPLQQGMDDLGRRLSFASICVIVAIGVAGLLRGERLLDVFTIGVSLAVAAIPEGLPICVAVTLALGVMRMARRNAVVKRLPAVEALGCTDVLCVDKTGTLTLNEMSLAEIWCPPIALSGTASLSNGARAAAQREIRLRRLATPLDGEPPSSGGIELDPPLASKKSAHHRYALVVNNQEFSADILPSQVSRLIDAACVCSNATLSNGALDAAVGLPTEVAILAAARDLGVPDRRPELQRIHETPFTSDRKRMDVTVVDASSTRNKPATFVKGAFEAVWPEVSYCYANDVVTPVDAHVEQATRNAIHELSLRGLRVVTVAHSYYAPPPSQYRPTPRSTGLGSLGRSLFSSGADDDDDDDEEDDYYEEEAAAAALSVFPSSGGRNNRQFGGGGGGGVVAVSGNDDPATSGSRLVFLGLVALSDPARPSALAAVSALKDRGARVVMMTGDSRDTARAIARDVGILSDLEGLDASGEEIDRWKELGEVNTQLSRGVVVLYRVSPRHKLEIVRALQNSGSVVAMTGDGINDAPALRAADVGAIFHNIRNFITFQLSTSLAALGLVAVAHLLDFPTPLNAMQVLWINIIMDGPPAQSLGVEPVDVAVTRCPPRSRAEPIVTRHIFIRVITSAILICSGTLAVLASELPADETTDEATRRASTMTFTTFVFFDMFNALACRSDSAIVGSKRLPLAANRAFGFAVGGSILGQLSVIYWAPLRAVFHTEPLPLRDLFKILLVASSVLVLDIARKLDLFGLRRAAAFPLSPRTNKGNTKLGSPCRRTTALVCRAIAGRQHKASAQLDHVV
ncbi:hypothetical protein CTAYLR_004340, partial [Chrysophaeum taylorii]